MFVRVQRHTNHMKTPEIISYCRVSTDEQASSGLGMEAQRAAVSAYANRSGLAVRAEFVDEGVSGSLPIERRAGLTAALAAVKRGDILLVAKRDRLARDMYLTLTVEALLKKRGARLVSAAGEGTDTDDLGAMIQRTMFDLFGQVERELIRSRTRAAMAAKKARGERVGAVEYGFHLAADRVKLEPNPDEQKVIALVRELRRSGVPFRKIVARLNEMRVPSRKGTAWSLGQIQNILSKAA